MNLSGRSPLIGSGSHVSYQSSLRGVRGGGTLAGGGVDIQSGLQLIGHETHPGAPGPAHKPFLWALVVVVTGGVVMLGCKVRNMD